MKTTMIFAIVTLLISCNNVSPVIAEADELKCHGYGLQSACKNSSSCEYCDAGRTCRICAAEKKEKKETEK